jgi:outer membrane protein
MRTLRALGSSAAFCLLAASIPPAAGAADAELGLADAVRQALDANLDLAAQRRALAADREQIGIARSALLPQIGVGAQAQYLEDDRSDADRGNTTQESVSVSAGLTQVLYDETTWADFSVQKHVYAEQRTQFDAFRLSVVQDAATAFLELDRARALLDIQERNRELTARNLETSRARIAAGWSSDREVLRWESQLAANDTDVVQARTQVLVNRFELNRVRNQAAEVPITPLSASIEEYGWVYARKPIAEAIAEPEGDRRLRDHLVRVGLTRSPELTALDAAIAAEERLFLANQRAFWVPSLSLGAGVNHLAAHGSAPDFEETEWGVRAGLAFPLLEGGAKFAALRQTRESLASLRLQRRSAAQSIEQSIRAAFARASGAYTNVAFARTQQAAAQRNFDLVNESYVLGVASILALLDAQAQLLTANQAVTDALYGFLADLIAAEEQIALYPFLEPEPEMTELLDRFERELQAQP